MKRAQGFDNLKSLKTPKRRKLNAKGLHPEFRHDVLDTSHKGISDGNKAFRTWKPKGNKRRNGRNADALRRTLSPCIYANNNWYATSDTLRLTFATIDVRLCDVPDNVFLGNSIELPEKYTITETDRKSRRFDAKVSKAKTRYRNQDDLDLLYNLLRDALANNKNAKAGQLMFRISELEKTKDGD